MKRTSSSISFSLGLIVLGLAILPNQSNAQDLFPSVNPYNVVAAHLNAVSSPFHGVFSKINLPTIEGYKLENPKPFVPLLKASVVQAEPPKEVVINKVNVDPKTVTANVITDLFVKSTTTTPQPPQTQTILQNLTVPKVTTSSSISRDEVQKKIDEVTKSLRAELANSTASISSQVGLSMQALTLGTRINNLYNVSISGGSISSPTISTPTISGGLTSDSGSFTTLSVTGSATTTLANGINVTGGCISVAGTCISSSAGLGVSSSIPDLVYQTIGSTKYYNASSSASDNLVWNFNNGFISNASTTLKSTLLVSGLSTLTGFISNASSTIQGNLTVTGNSTTSSATTTSFFATTASTTNLFAALFGIATTAPSQALSVQGNALFSGSGTSTSWFNTTASSTNLFSSSLTIAGNGLVYNTVNGRVSIGTTTPLAKLEVASTTLGTSDLISLLNATSATSSGSRLLFKANDFFNATTTGAITGFLDRNFLSGSSSLAFSTLQNGTLTEGFRLNGLGFFGLGTTSPTQVLSVQGNGLFSGTILGSNLTATGTLSVFGASTFTGLPTFTSGFISNASSTILGNFTITGNSTTSSATTTSFFATTASSTNSFTGRLGVATTSPWAALSVTGTVAFNGLSTNVTGNAVCITTGKEITDSGASACVPSSIRYKENVQTLSAGFGLDELSKLRVVSFDYKPGTYSPEDLKGSYGMIAEEVQLIDPKLVDFNYDGTPQTLKFEKILGLTVQGVQELNEKLTSSEERLNRLETIDGLLGVATSTEGVNAWLVDHVDGSPRVNFLGDINLGGHNISDIANISGIGNKWSINQDGKLVADEVDANKLCLGTVCVTEGDLRALLIHAGINTNTSSTTDNNNIPDVPPPPPAPNPSPSPDPSPEPTPEPQP